MKFEKILPRAPANQTVTPFWTMSRWTWNIWISILSMHLCWSIISFQTIRRSYLLLNEDQFLSFLTISRKTSKRHWKWERIYWWSPCSYIFQAIDAHSVDIRERAAVDDQISRGRVRQSIYGLSLDETLIAVRFPFVVPTHHHSLDDLLESLQIHEQKRRVKADDANVLK